MVAGGSYAFISPPKVSKPFSPTKPSYVIAFTNSHHTKIKKMASTSAIVFATTTMLLIAYYGASAQDAPAPEYDAAAPAPGPSSTDCFTVLLGMEDCLSYVQDGSNLTTPDKPCCPELKGLVDNNPVCLCYLLANTNTFGIKIDYNKALKLPSVCKVDTPPPSLCSREFLLLA